MIEHFDDDQDTPTEADLQACYGTKYLSAAEIGARKIRTKLAKIRQEELRQNNGTRKKFVLYFDGLDKPMVLNGTNKQTLTDALGTKPENWIGAEIGIFTVPVQFNGKTVQGLRLRVLGKPGAAVAKPTAPNLQQRRLSPRGCPKRETPGSMTVPTSREACSVGRTVMAVRPTRCRGFACPTTLTTLRKFRHTSQPGVD